MPRSQPEGRPEGAGTTARRLVGSRHVSVQWLTLLVASVALVGALELAGIPAALLLGPMAAAIAVAALGGRVAVPALPFQVAQAVVGCMIARSITPAILGTILQGWPVFLGAIVSVILAACVLGVLLARWQVLPGTVAIWGSFPGAASAMTLMADAFGADVRLVAFMQYLRVVMVAAVASLVARFSAIGSGAPPDIVWFPPVAWPALAATLAVVIVALAAARALRIPAGPLILPLAASATLQDAGLLAIELPPWLLAASYALVGWSIGLRFTPAILRHVARALPRVALSILTLIALCGCLAAVLVVGFGIDPLTAYLATSPGGADAVAIIAASSKVDVPFVMALQTGRFLVVLLIGPALARLVVRLTGRSDEDVA